MKLPLQTGPLAWLCALLVIGSTAFSGANVARAVDSTWGPGPADNPTLGINGGVRVRVGFNASATTTKMGELSGTGTIGGGNGAAGNHTLEIGHLNTDSAFSGDIIHFTGAGLVLSLKKVGTGSLTLSGPEPNSACLLLATALGFGCLALRSRIAYKG